MLPDTEAAKICALSFIDNLYLLSFLWNHITFSPVQFSEMLQYVVCKGGVRFLILFYLKITLKLCLTCLTVLLFDISNNILLIFKT